MVSHFTTIYPIHYVYMSYSFIKLTNNILQDYKLTGPLSILKYFFKMPRFSEFLLMWAGRLLKALQPEYNTPLWTIDKFVDSRCKSKLFPVLRLWISIFCTNKFPFSVTNTSSEKIYWEGNVKICICLKKMFTWITSRFIGDNPNYSLLDFKNVSTNRGVTPENDTVHH